MSQTATTESERKDIKREWREAATDEDEPLAPLFAATFRRRYGEEP